MLSKAVKSAITRNCHLSISSSIKLPLFIMSHCSMITYQQSSFVQAPAFQTDVAPHRHQNTCHTCQYLPYLSLTCPTCHTCTLQVMESPAFETDVAPRRRQNTWATLDPEYGN